MIKKLSKKNKKHFKYTELNGFLKKKHFLNIGSYKKYKDHLNSCRDCWRIWNQVRWDGAMKSQGLQELKDYLGDDFQRYFDSSWALAGDWLLQKPKTKKEVAEFYKSTKHYLYNLIIWDASGDRDDFEEDFLRLAKRFNINSVIDYGCGVGTDGLKFLKRDKKVYFVDYVCPSTKFLKWRLKSRNLKVNVYNVEKLKKLQKADMLWAIDVLEHMVDPLEVIDMLSDETRVFVHRSEFGNQAGGRQPCHFNYSEFKLNRRLKKEGFKHIPWKRLSVWVR